MAKISKTCCRWLYVLSIRKTEILINCWLRPIPGGYVCVVRELQILPLTEYNLVLSKEGQRNLGGGDGWEIQVIRNNIWIASRNWWDRGYWDRFFVPRFCKQCHSVSGFMTASLEKYMLVLGCCRWRITLSGKNKWYVKLYHWVMFYCCYVMFRNSGPNRILLLLQNFLWAVNKYTY